MALFMHIGINISLMKNFLNIKIQCEVCICKEPVIAFMFGSALEIAILKTVFKSNKD